MSQDEGMGRALREMEERNRPPVRAKASLHFKGPDQYLTNEGYPAGTVCWYVLLEADGLRLFVCADDPATALERAGEKLRSILGRPSFPGSSST
jgi:hypothetical protein